MTKTYNIPHTLSVLPNTTYKPELYRLAGICKDMDALGIDVERVYRKLQDRLLQKSEREFERVFYGEKNGHE